MIDALPINITDLVVIGVIAVSGLLAFARGLVREVLSIAGWAVAVIVTIYAFPFAKPFLREYITFTLLADIVTGLSIFLVTLIICSAISHVLSRQVRGSAFGALDRSLGLLFGVVRGVVLLCVAYLFLSWAVPPEERPGWMTEARSLPVIVAGADWLRSLGPDSAGTGLAAAESGRPAAPGPGSDLGPERLPAAEPAAGVESPRNSAGPKEGSGYNDAERRQLDRLIQGLQ